MATPLWGLGATHHLHYLIHLLRRNLFFLDEETNKRTKRASKVIVLYFIHYPTTVLVTTDYGNKE